MIENGRGRVDQLFTALVRLGCERVEQRTGVDLWAHGFERVTAEIIEHCGIPTEPIDISMTLARNVFGILPEAPRSRVRIASSGERRRRRRPSASHPAMSDPTSPQMARGSGGRRRGL